MHDGWPLLLWGFIPVCPRMVLPEFLGWRPWVLVDWGVRYPLGARLQEHPRGCDQADGDGTAVALKSQVYAGAETPDWPVAPSISVVPAQVESYSCSEWMG